MNQEANVTPELTPEHKALVAIRKLRGELDRLRTAAAEPIAVVGMACRFPAGANSLQAYWSKLNEGYDAIREVPADRWNVEDYYDPDYQTPGKMASRWGGFLDQVSDFDHLFFNISPREALSIDPQQRLLLEVSWEALEDAGLTRKDLAASSTGVFVGIMNSDYSWCNAGNPLAIGPYDATGAAHSVASGRISYTFDLRGPSMAVDTACSSSLVALHLACQSLRAQECSAALAGGVNVIVRPESTLATSRIGALAADGRCKVFDARANGYVRGEGCGVAVLKRLSDAQAAGDRVWAVIRGSAVNQDGRSAGLTAPNPESQKRVIRAALRAGAVDPRQVSYIETHGTGTPLGDPIEIQALLDQYGDSSAPGALCMLGSVKANLGHLESAAGMASFIKTVLALHHGQLPPQRNFETLNPNIEIQHSRLRIVDKVPQAWQPAEGVRVAGVSSFGISGTNAHLIVEQAPTAALEPRPMAAGSGMQLLLISGQTRDSLRQTALHYRDVLRDRAELDVERFCSASVLRRTHLPQRIALIGADQSALHGTLAALLDGRKVPDAEMAGGASSNAARIAFIFSGQGPAWGAVAKRLRERDAGVRAFIAEYDAVLQPIAGFRVADMLALPDAEAELALRQPSRAQPVLLCLQLALFRRWESFGVVPDAVVGHSFGEIAAAHVAGAFSLADAVALAHARGTVIESAPQDGRMAIVQLGADDTRRAIRELGAALEVAAINGPTSTVISGQASAVAALVAQLDARGTYARMLEAVTYAAHGTQMLAAAERLAERCAWLTPRDASVTIVSTVTGRAIAGRELGAQYWARNLASCVQFEQAIGFLHAQAHSSFVEINPLPALSASAASCLVDTDAAVIPTLESGDDNVERMLMAPARLHVRGHEIAWERCVQARGHVTLPGTPWQRARFWKPDSIGRAGLRPGHGWLGRPMPLASVPDTTVWDSTISLHSLPYLRDHVVGACPLLPASAYLDALLEAARAQWGEASGEFEAVEFRQPLVVSDEETPLQTSARKSSAGGFEFQLATRQSDASWRVCATARGVRPLSSARADANAADSAAIDAIRARCTRALPVPELYESLTARGLMYGPSFRCVERLWQGDGEVFASVRLPDDVSDSGYHAHPSLLDACLHSAAAIATPHAQPGVLYVPAGCERMIVWQPIQGVLRVHAALRPARDGQAGEALIGDVRIFAARGSCVAELTGLRLQPALGAQPAAAASAHEQSSWLYEVLWERSLSDRPACPRRGTWLVLCDRRGVGDELVRRLQAEGHRCTVVRRESHVPSRASLAASIDRMPDDWLGTVHLWNLDARDPAGDTLSEDIASGCLSVQDLVQALAQSGRHAPLWLITEHTAHFAQRTTARSLPQSLALGLMRALPLELPDLRYSCLDIDAQTPALAAEYIVQELCAVTDSRAPHEHQIARDASGRWLPRIRPKAVPPLPEPTRSTISAQGTYLITGGLGALGLLCAQWLVERGARQIVLVGRRGPGSAAESSIERLRQRGCNVVVRSTNISDPGAARALFDELRSSLPPLRGVLHSAVVLRDRAFSELDHETTREVLAPKVQGAWLLHELTRDLPLDFFVLFSSVASVIGSPGQASYAAANAFLDALAHHRRQQGLPGLSINWGPWAEVGLAAELAQQQESAGKVAAQLVKMIDPRQGFELLERFLGTESAGLTQIAAVPYDLRSLLQYFPQAAQHGFYQRVLSDSDAAMLGRQHTREQYKRPDLAQAYIAARNETEEVIQTIWQRVLRIEQVGVKDTFFELGGDSVLVGQILTQVYRHFGIGNLNREALFKEFTVETLAHAVEEALLAELDQVSDEEAVRLLELAK